jgi:hypothetical protein
MSLALRFSFLSQPQENLGLNHPHRNCIDRTAQRTKITSNTGLGHIQNRIALGVGCFRCIGQRQARHGTDINANFTRHAHVDLNAWLGPSFFKADPLAGFLILVQDRILRANFATGTTIDAPLRNDLVILIALPLDAVNRANLFTQTAPDTFICERISHIALLLLKRMLAFMKASQK